MQNYLVDMGYAEFEKREELSHTLGYELIRGLLKNSDRVVLVDQFSGETLTGKELLNRAIAFSEVVKSASAKGRIGVILPPTKQSVIINIACVFAKKVPVNLNFTMGKTAAMQCREASDIDIEITTDYWFNKITGGNQTFPWTQKTLDYDAIAPTLEVKNFGGKSVEEICEFLSLEKCAKNSKKEATLIFTSGSEGAPKAAILTERNIIANCIQTQITKVFEDGDMFFGNLPVFHSFGLLFEVWLPAICGLKILLAPSPIDIKANIRAIRDFKPSVMIGSPTFFRAYIRHANPSDMNSLRKVIAGAEKTPAGFHELWNKTFPNALYCEGYGLTETSPVAGVNLPERDFGWYSTGTRMGSIGKLFVGMQAKIVSAEDSSILPFGEQGLLAMRGANVFAGYGNNEAATKRTLMPDGWLITGDLARLDKDGFVYVDGRLSRFSKVGAEMVPHATVEAALSRALNLASSDTPLIAISARVDKDKGEALVLLTTIPMEMSKVKSALKREGISNLWMPKHIIKVAKIPVLASGKLNLKELAELAKG